MTTAMSGAVAQRCGPIAMVGPFRRRHTRPVRIVAEPFVLALPFVLVVGLLADRVLPSRQAERTRGGPIFSAAQALRMALIAAPFWSCRWRACPAARQR